MHKILIRTLCGALIATAAHADDLALKVEHETVALGADGVTRITRFGERLIRRDNQSWVARILPPGAHEEADHQAGGKTHKHMDVSAASRWVQRGEDGKLRVRIVNGHEKMIVDVAPVDYANIGFDGRWTTAAQLLDPEQIKRMKPIPRSAPAGARWYEGGTRDAKVQVLWDESARYPRRIESTNASGTQRATLTATREAMPATLPWATLTGYAQKEYSDLLD
ncbi:hypothetical protein [Zoogloea sp.]|uniref:hypothetical protein n=1 Tax=Zoogloea sp. TaxID=49181 RepID=UPI0035AEF2EC